MDTTTTFPRKSDVLAAFHEHSYPAPDLLEVIDYMQQFTPPEAKAFGECLKDLFPELPNDEIREILGMCYHNASLEAVSALGEVLGADRTIWNAVVDGVLEDYGPKGGWDPPFTPASYLHLCRFCDEVVPADKPSRDDPRVVAAVVQGFWSASPHH